MVPVRINGDADRESNERLFIGFKDATNATIGGLYGLGFVTITNDD